MKNSTCFEKTAAQRHEEVDLTDDEVQRLLHDAESRLRVNQRNIQPSLTVEIPDGQLVTGSPLPSSSTPHLEVNHSVKSYLSQKNDVTSIDSSRIVDHKSMDVFHPTNCVMATGSKRPGGNTRATAGSDWFDMPKTELTPELRRDLQLIRMRSVLDPKRHYKKDNAKAKAPEFSQVGTVIEGSTEFFGARISKRDRKRTFVEEALAIEKDSKRLASRYTNVQTSKRSGKRSFYHNLRTKRDRSKQ
ncbi:hypothetical protein ASPZODRAFT_135705 [Penicilliopsis zonata CBS 506.65]|uniref:Fcf2 pre-rRNA processing C-terminal domain-containing protein n=1 Tax=Penicilliopsis zonata CBS 506.65 TaxID=1073090 RepID=A0A1L9S9A3_9EURO|nr:hypothetical protein ASPZODRAFT_135705 [Penicilliopsis zonata CBS 506.65]OJJ43709.1 hypothetical protein ASPZODRAFT_135705 [Penicilliopsis zonata CBS 506.65]